MAALWYRSGNLTLTQGSNEVTGDTTMFLANIRAGDMLIAPTSDIYEVTAVLSDTSLTIDREYDGASYTGTAWAIAPTSANLKLLAKQIAELVALYQEVPDTVSAGVAAAQDAAQASQDSRDAAANSATLADGSASTATGKAAEAAQSATDAAASRDTAVSASGAAAVAQVAAEAAQASAESTASAANTTLTNANAAVDAANAAVDAANSASSSAQASATEAANSAKDAADDAASAISTANAATETADDAVEYAAQLATNLSSLDSRLASLWNGTTLNLMPGGRFVTGNFDGAHTSTTTSFRQGQSSTSVTYLPVVPPVGGNSAFTICRSAADANSKFVALGIDGNSNFVDLTFSRHGTAAPPAGFRFVSANGEMGRITTDNSWILGPYWYVPNISARSHIFHIGGGTQYGMSFRPQLFADSVAIQFQAYNGAVAGYIQSNGNLSTVYATTSDYRSKTVLGTMTPSAALESVMRLRPITFRMNGVAVVTLPLEGFVAHELQAVIPQAVTGQKDETRVNDEGKEVPVMQGVDLSKIVPTLVAAMQEQQRTITELTQRVETLEAAQQPQST